MSLDRYVNLIACGAITRERACDGKMAFRTPEYAEKKAQQKERQYGVPTRYYHCPFCRCYHLATDKEAA